jgi:hypothetical protein
MKLNFLNHYYKPEGFMQKRYINFFSFIFFILSFTTTDGTIDCVLTHINNQMPQSLIFTLRYNTSHFRRLLQIPPETTLSLTEEEKIFIPEATTQKHKTTGKCIEITIPTKNKNFRITDIHCEKHFIKPRYNQSDTHELISCAMYQIIFFSDEFCIYTYEQPFTWNEIKYENIEIPFMMTINPYGKIIVRPVNSSATSNSNAKPSAKSTRTQSM